MFRYTVFFTFLVVFASGLHAEVPVVTEEEEIVLAINNIDDDFFDDGEAFLNPDESMEAIVPPSIGDLSEFDIGNEVAAENQDNNMLPESVEDISNLVIEDEGEEVISLDDALESLPEFNNESITTPISNIENNTIAETAEIDPDSIERPEFMVGDSALRVPGGKYIKEVPSIPMYIDKIDSSMLPPLPTSVIAARKLEEELVAKAIVQQAEDTVDIADSPLDEEVVDLNIADASEELELPQLEENIVPKTLDFEDPEVIALPTDVPVIDVVEEDNNEKTAIVAEVTEAVNPTSEIDVDDFIEQTEIGVLEPNVIENDAAPDEVVTFAEVPENLPLDEEGVTEGGFAGLGGDDKEEEKDKIEIFSYDVVDIKSNTIGLIDGVDLDIDNFAGSDLETEVASAEKDIANEIDKRIPYMGKVPDRTYSPYKQRTRPNYMVQNIPTIIHKKRYRDDNEHLPTSRYQIENERDFIRAASSGDLNKMRSLQKFIKNIGEISFGGETALMVAVKNGQIDSVRYLIASGVNVNAQNKDGIAPIHIVVTRNRPDILRLLLASGADYNVADNKGNLAFNYAMNSGYFELVPLVTDDKFDINQKNTYGDTALLRAIKMQLPQQVRFLLQYDSDIEVSDKNGYTPLMLAAYTGQMHTVNLLLHYGANPNVKDQYGRDASQIASMVGHSDVSRRIMGAIINNKLAKYSGAKVSSASN